MLTLLNSNSNVLNSNFHFPDAVSFTASHPISSSVISNTADLNLSSGGSGSELSPVNCVRSSRPQLLKAVIVRVIGLINLTPIENHTLIIKWIDRMP